MVSLKGIPNSDDTAKWPDRHWATVPSEPPQRCQFDRWASASLSRSICRALLAQPAWRRRIARSETLDSAGWREGSDPQAARPPTPIEKKGTPTGETRLATSRNICLRIRSHSWIDSPYSRLLFELLGEIPSTDVKERAYAMLRESGRAAWTQTNWPPRNPVRYGHEPVQRDHAFSPAKTASADRF